MAAWLRLIRALRGSAGISQGLGGSVSTILGLKSTASLGAVDAGHHPYGLELFRFLPTLESGGDT